jgi:hypothetical protein
MTERTECTFVVKESGIGVPYVVAEPSTDSGQLISFELGPLTTLDGAHEVARFMRSHIRAISFSWGIPYVHE